MRSLHILTISSANMDLIAQADRVPAGGQTLLGTSFEYACGGKGSNSALTFARLGAKSIFCSRIGSDANGDALLSMWDAAGIDTRFVRRDAREKTGMALVLVEGDGENRIIVYPGANTRLSRADAEEALTSLPDALFLHFEIPAETVLYAVSAAAASDIPMPVFIDAGPASRDFPLEQLAPVEVFSPNESETEVYTGIRPDGSDNCFRACQILEKRVKAKYYVLKLGDRGCFMYDGMHYNFFPPVEVRAVDTTGAGDAFSAALTLEYMRSHDIGRACQFANIVGALTVTRVGASASMPTTDEVSEFILSNGIAFRMKT